MAFRFVRIWATQGHGCAGPVRLAAARRRGRGAAYKQEDHCPQAGRRPHCHCAAEASHLHSTLSFRFNNFAVPLAVSSAISK
jgi:hypothetical protein